MSDKVLFLTWTIFQWKIKWDKLLISLIPSNRQVEPALIFRWPAFEFLALPPSHLWTNTTRQTWHVNEKTICLPTPYPCRTPESPVVRALSWAVAERFKFLISSSPPTQARTLTREPWLCRGESSSTSPMKLLFIYITNPLGRVWKQCLL